MSGANASGQHAVALELWRAQAPLLGRDAARPAFRLLACHGQRGADCVAAFRAYAED
jgi:hypothetical protein